MSDEWLKQVWPEAYDEQQAHAMSQSEAVQHVSDAAAAAYAGTRRESLEHACRSRGNVLRTVEEWEEMEAAARDYWTIRGEADMLRSQFAAKTAAFECAMQQVKDAQDLARKAIDELQRLREGREDENGNRAANAVEEETTHQSSDARATDDSQNALPHRDAARALLRANSLDSHDSHTDPRLGVQQPEGEPGEPMPYWRRSGV